jgi:hypothetical protein
MNAQETSKNNGTNFNKSQNQKDGKQNETSLNTNNSGPVLTTSPNPMSKQGDSKLNTVIHDAADRFTSGSSQAVDKAQEIYGQATDKASDLLESATEFAKSRKGMLIGAVTAAAAIGILGYFFTRGSSETTAEKKAS